MSQITKKTREPRQERSIHLKQKILETAIKKFSEKGFYNTSSNEISAAAGVSVGSFYSYFKDKKELFIEAIKYLDVKIDSVINIEEISAIKNKKEFIKKLFSNILAAHKIFPGFQKELSAMQILDPDISKVHEKIEKRTLDTYFKNLLFWKDQITPKNLEATSFILFKTVDVIVHDIVDNKTKIDEGILIKELTDMISRYLFTA
jgi:AcrR family transcriptional regulator